MIGNDDVLVVGAGPHALTLAAYLAGQRSGASRLRVVDPSGRWLDRWHHQMAAYAIPVLRSPSVHHPHPDPTSCAVMPSASGRSSTAPTCGRPATSSRASAEH